MYRAAAGVVVLLAVLVATGCGESAEEKYRDDFAQLNDEIVALGKQVGTTIDEAGGTTDAQLADAFGDYARALDDLQRRVEQLEPPDNLADEQATLVEAMGDVQGTLARIADAALRTNPDAAREATVELIQGSRSLSEAREALARAVG